jgi:excisionase family DNA binding protein
MDEDKDWFTVEEAADYLGVSEPTVFRWMKDGILSFYKVGGATRFRKEGLDAIFEKTTGRKEAEAVAGRCVACGNALLVDGRLQGIGRLYFRPDKSKFWSLEEPMVDIRVYACSACGFLQLRADTAKLDRLKPAEKGS